MIIISTVQRDFRLQLSIFKANVGTENVSYGSFDSEETEVEGESTPNTTEKEMEFTVGGDVTVDFWQYVYLKYQIQWDSTSERKDINQDEYGCKPYYVPVEAVCEGKPIPNATDQENGVFAYANEGGISSDGYPQPSLMHSLSLGLYPMLVQEKTVSGYEERSVSLEAGVAAKNYTITRGWVKDGVLEVADEKETEIWGATWGIQYQYLTSTKGDPSGNFGFRAGIKGTHFPGNTNIFTFELSIPIGLGF
jgi:hypothetical protein